MKHRIAALAALAVLSACGETPTASVVSETAKLARTTPAANLVYTSGSNVQTWNAIPEYNQPSNFSSTYCTASPKVGLTANWQNPHNAFVVGGHPWFNWFANESWFFTAPWINAWNNLNSSASGNSTWPNYNWTKYETTVQGNGDFVIRLLADNCSWIYLDNTLVGVQGDDLTHNAYGLTLNGTHTLSFIIFDGGGAAGGMFKLETTTNPPPSLNNDLDNDGHQNGVDDFPLDPTRWDADNLVANGSFEHPAIKAGPWPLPNGVLPWQIFNSTNQGLTGWTVEANTADTQRGEVGFQFTGVPDGVQVLDLNNGRISQAVATTANYKYRVSFSLSKNYVCANGSVRVLVAFGGASQEFTFSAGGNAQNMTWDAHTLDAVSTGASETLRFTATAFGGCGGPMLDAVRIESMGPADNTPPTIVPHITGTLGTNGWYTSNVGVSWTVTDNESAVTSTDGCGATSVTQDTNGITLTCKATSAGGTESESVTIKRDASPPVVTPTVSGTEGLGGWYVSDVTVSWTTVDGMSGIASTNGCSPITTTIDNDGTHYICIATDGGGLADTSKVFAKRDATRPVIAYAGNAFSYTVDQTVAITCSASDAMSGLASNTCANISGAAYTFNIGINVYSASAHDNAGNSNTASTGFTVTVTSGSLCTLVQRWVSNAGVANSLCVKLRQGSYGAFRNEVSAQSGKKFLSAANAAILLQLVNELD